MDHTITWTFTLNHKASFTECLAQLLVQWQKHPKRVKVAFLLKFSCSVAEFLHCKPWCWMMNVSSFEVNRVGNQSWFVELCCLFEWTGRFWLHLIHSIPIFGLNESLFMNYPRLWIALWLPYLMMLLQFLAFWKMAFCKEGSMQPADKGNNGILHFGCVLKILTG